MRATLFSNVYKRAEELAAAGVEGGDPRRSTAFFYFFSAKICPVWVRSLSVHRNSATGSHSFLIQYNVRFLLYQYLCLEHGELFPLGGKGENIAAKMPFPLTARTGFAACVSERWELQHKIFLPCLSATK